MLKDQALQANTTPSGPSRLSEAINALDWEKVSRLAIEDQAEREAVIRRRRTAEVQAASRRLWLEWGGRYQYCTLDNFAVSVEAQQKVKDRLRAFAEEVAIQPSIVAGLVLMGPPGTGKDHLMAALMHGALASRLIVKWTSGLGLFRRLRDAIDSEVSEGGLLRTYTTPDILAISDPSWERQPISRWERQRLGEIVDERWNNCRPIWMTINAEGPADIERLLGCAMVDRLRDGALSLACDWESFRQSLGDHKLTRPRGRKPEGEN